MAKRIAHAKIVRPRSRRKIIYPWPTQRQTSAIEEMHGYNIDVVNFRIYLVGEEKVYHGEEDDYTEPGVEYIMTSRFIKNLDILSGRNPERPILIAMKTCGGNGEEGMAIYDAIISCPNPITILSYTHARSMSSLILQAADKRVLMPHSYFMFHEGTVGAEDTYKGFLTYAEWMRKTSSSMIDIYSQALKRKGKFHTWSLQRIQKMLQDCMDKKQEMFLTAQEAVEWGFADEVFGGNGSPLDWTKLITYD